MNVIILGANGKVGSKVAAELIKKGHTVTAGVHKNQDFVPAQAQVVTIDIHDQTSMERVITGADVVVCALSSWHAPNHDILSTAMKTVIPAMQKMGIKRIVSVSGDIVRLPGEASTSLAKLIGVLAFGSIRAIIKDSQNHLDQLYQSDLDWTVIRPTTMKESDDAEYTFQQKHPRGMLISRAAVVASIVDLVETGSHIHEAPFIAPKR